MTIFGLAPQGRAHCCSQHGAGGLLDRIANDVGYGFRMVKSKFFQESLSSEMSRAYNEGYKCSPQIIGKICAVAASLVSAAYSGMYSGVMTCLMINPVLSPVSLLVIFGAALGAAAIIISRDKQDIIHGMMGGGYSGRGCDFVW